jgi:putative transposase
VTTQCELLGVARATVYYKPVPTSEQDLQFMKLIDAQFTETPFYGRRRMAVWLSKKVGYAVNVKHVRRLMVEMGLQAIYPKPNASKAHPAHKKYPYLLRDFNITGKEQVWSTDITYVRLEKGFAYLVAIIDWHSRYVLSWRLSNTLDTDFCLMALDEALTLGTPSIFNTDQGCQFTSALWTDRLIEAGITISMDGRGRALDNIFVERLWRSVKYENIYPSAYKTLGEALEGLKKYFEFYNNERPHQALDYETPWAVHHTEGAGEQKGMTVSRTRREEDLLRIPIFLS